MTKKIKKKNPITIKKYLKGLLNDNLYLMLSNYSIEDVSIESFFEMYGQISPEEVVEFILNPKNSFKLGLFGHRASGDSKIPAYNGKRYFHYDLDFKRKSINTDESLELY